MQLDFISLDAWQAFGELCLHRDIVLYRLATRQSNDLANRFIDIEGILPRRRLLDESTDPADDVDGSIAFSDGMTERFPDLRQMRWLGVQPVQSRLGIVDPRRNRLHDFMGNRGRQLPHRRDAIDVREFRLRFVQRF